MVGFGRERGDSSVIIWDLGKEGGSPGLPLHRRAVVDPFSCILTFSLQAD